MVDQRAVAKSRGLAEEDADRGAVSDRFGI
jgi:hypothetical protein